MSYNTYCIPDGTVNRMTDVQHEATNEETQSDIKPTVYINLSMPIKSENFDNEIDEVPIPLNIKSPTSMKQDVWHETIRILPINTNEESKPPVYINQSVPIKSETFDNDINEVSIPLYIRSPNSMKPDVQDEATQIIPINTNEETQSDIKPTVYIDLPMPIKSEIFDNEIDEVPTPFYIRANSLKQDVQDEATQIIPINTNEETQSDIQPPVYIDQAVPIKTETFDNDINEVPIPLYIRSSTSMKQDVWHETARIVPINTNEESQPPDIKPLVKIDNQIMSMNSETFDNDTNDAPPPLYIRSPASSNQGPTHMTKKECELKHTIIKLKAELCRLNKDKMLIKRKLRDTKQASKAKQCESFIRNLSDTCKTFLQMQITQAGKKINERHFNLNEKLLALSLYNASQKAYRVLSKMFILPHRRTLEELKKDSDLRTRATLKLK